jgi:hypothetical protein
LILLRQLLFFSGRCVHKRLCQILIDLCHAWFGYLINNVMGWPCASWYHFDSISKGVIPLMRHLKPLIHTWTKILRDGPVIWLLPNKGVDWFSIELLTLSHSWHFTVLSILLIMLNFTTFQQWRLSESEGKHVAWSHVAVWTSLIKHMRLAGIPIRHLTLTWTVTLTVRWWIFY